MPWNVLMRPGSPGSEPSFRRTRDTQTRRYCRSSRYSGPQTLVSSSVWSTTLPAFAARCWSSSHSVRDSWTISPSRVTTRRSRSISMSSNFRIPAPGCAPLDAAQDRADARRELVGVERLGDVVVGAEVEALGLVRGGPLGRQQDDRDRAALAELAHDLDAVEVGHDDVQQDDVRADLLGLGQRLLAAVGGDDAEALLAEGERDEFRDARLVVGDEHERLGAQGMHLLGDVLPMVRHPALRRRCNRHVRVLAVIAFCKVRPR